jgi:hypothetical protein
MPYEMLHVFGKATQMVMATRYRIKLLSTTYIDSDVTSADSSLKYNVETNSAQGQSTA